MGGDCLPHADRRMDTTDGRRGQTGRQPVICQGESASLILSERVLSGLSGMGVDSPSIRSPAIIRGAEQPASAHRAETTCHRRRRLGKAAMGWNQLDRDGFCLGAARKRILLPARYDQGPGGSVALRRPPDRRNPTASCWLHLSAVGLCHRRRGANLPAGRARQQDQHGVSQAGRCSRWRGSGKLGTCSPAPTIRC